VLEATMNAVGFYEKMGFEVRDELSMVLPRRGADEPTEVYEERCMVWVPGRGIVIG
jgi:ribosomal protein S18 acetylase RimI-like enzyme